MAVEYILEILLLVYDVFLRSVGCLSNSLVSMVPSWESLHHDAELWINLFESKFVGGLNMASDFCKSAFTDVLEYCRCLDWKTSLQPVETAFMWIFNNSARIGSLMGMMLAILMAAYIIVTSVAKVMLILLDAESTENLKKTDDSRTCDHTPAEYCTMNLFDLAKTAYEPGHTEALIKQLEVSNYDINFALSSNGLSLFLCACLSGQRRLINYMLKHGADVKMCTKDGDSAFYLGTYGVLSSPDRDIGMLKDLLMAGCKVNQKNVRGYTALHRAASKGNKDVVKFLLENGADPYVKSKSGVYPIDSATNAGHLEVAELLEISVTDTNVWDDVDPHTPVKATLGLMSPRRKHLVESTFQGSRILSKQDMFSRET